MKYFGGKNGKYLIVILVLLVILIFGMSFYMSYNKAEGFTITSTSNGISNIKDVLSLPGVSPGSLPSSAINNWAMVNEIVEPDGTVVQDIVNTDGTVLTITNSQNVVNTGKNVDNTTPGVTQSGNGGMVNGNTYNRNTF